VDFPAPFGPSSATVSPLPTAKLTPSSAVTTPYRLVTPSSTATVCRISHPDLPSSLVNGVEPRFARPAREVPTLRTSP
jgi:hypothetical protein